MKSSCAGAVVICLTLAVPRPVKSSAEPTQQNSQEAAKLNQLGVGQLQKKEYDAAIASFREALQRQPEFPEALDNLGKALEATGKDGEAVADFDKAIQLAPQN